MNSSKDVQFVPTAKYLGVAGGDDEIKAYHAKNDDHKGPRARTGKASRRHR